MPDARIYKLSHGEAVGFDQARSRMHVLKVSDGRTELALDLVMKGTDHKVSGTLVAHRVEHIIECP